MNKKIIGFIILILVIIIGTVTILFLTNKSQKDNNRSNENNQTQTEMNNNSTNNNTESSNNSKNDGDDNSMIGDTFKIKATVNGEILYATLENNATTRDFVKMLPISLPMMDLYDREMCYRFEDALNTDNLQSNRYEIGEIAYWPPRHSFVILYEQNGEIFERQTLGKFDSSVDIFKSTGDIDVMFELVE